MRCRFKSSTGVLVRTCKSCISRIRRSAGLWLKSIDPPSKIYGHIPYELTEYHPNCVASRMIFKSPFFEKMSLHLLSDYISPWMIDKREPHQRVQDTLFEDAAETPSTLCSFLCVSGWLRHGENSWPRLVGQGGMLVEKHQNAHLVCGHLENNMEQKTSNHWWCESHVST